MRLMKCSIWDLLTMWKRFSVHNLKRKRALTIVCVFSMLNITMDLSLKVFCDGQVESKTQQVCRLSFLVPLCHSGLSRCLKTFEGRRLCCFSLALWGDGF